MKLSEYLKPAIGVVVVVAVGVYYWLGHRPRPEEKEIPTKAMVIVTKSTNACFSDLVRVTGFIVPRREAVVGVEHEGFTAEGRRCVMRSGRTSAACARTSPT